VETAAAAACCTSARGYSSEADKDGIKPDWKRARRVVDHRLSQAERVNWETG